MKMLFSLVDQQDRRTIEVPRLEECGKRHEGPEAVAPLRDLDPPWPAVDQVLDINPKELLGDLEADRDLLLLPLLREERLEPVVSLLFELAKVVRFSNRRADLR